MSAQELQFTLQQRGGTVGVLQLQQPTGLWSMIWYSRESLRCPLPGVVEII